MASNIRIKRSGVSVAPSSLKLGELAYSYVDLDLGGDRLYIGTGGESADGNALNIDVIGGKAFTTLLDHTAGTLTTNSALIVDSDGKIDRLLVDNITINSNTISATNSNGDINLLPGGSGVVNVSNKRVVNVASPTSGSDAATKGYVDGITGGTSIQLRLSTINDSDTISIVDSDLVIFGGNGLTSSFGTNRNVIRLDLDPTAVTPGTYGSTTAIPYFIVDSQGRITEAGTFGINVDSSINSIVDSAYIQARQKDFFRDSAFTTGIVDSAYIQARQIQQDFSYTSLTDVPDLFDSADATTLVDSAYIQARQITYNTNDFTDSNFVQSRINIAINDLIDGAPGALNTLNELAAALGDDSDAYNTLLSSIDALPDSAQVVGLIDAAHVQARQDYSYTSLTDLPDFFDSNDATILVDSAYVQARQDYSYLSLTDVPNPDLFDSADAVLLVDSAYVQARQTPQDFSYTSLIDVPDLLDSADARLLIDSSFVQLRQDYSYSSLTGVPDLFDSNDAVRLVDADYVRLRQDYSYSSLTGLPDFFDSADAVLLIDSAYVQARQANFDQLLDSAEVIQLVDSAYVQARQTPQDFAYSSLTGIPDLFDSADATILVDSAYVQARQDFAYSSLTGIPTGLLDSNTLTSVVDSAYVQARQDYAYTSLTGVPDLFDSSDADIHFSSKTTNDLTEGSTNLYYTTARADSDAKNAVSAIDAGGDGSFAYNSTTGEFTYTGPSASETRAHFSGGVGITYDQLTGTFVVDSNSTVTINKIVVDSGETKRLKFDTTTFTDVDVPNNLPAFEEGNLFYFQGPDALTYSNASINVKIGQDEVVRVYNNTASQIDKGAVVYVTGASNDFPTIDLAKADDFNTVYNTLGLASHNIGASQFGFVTVRGLFGGLNTEQFTVGDRVHVSFDSAGKLTTSQPDYPNYPYEIGTVLVSDSATGGNVGGCIQVDPRSEVFEGIRVQGNQRVDGDLTISGNINILGTETKTTVTNLNVGDNFIYIGAGDTLTATFSGTGLNDATFKDYYEGDSDLSYYVRIDSADAGGDYIQWSFDSNFSSLEGFDSANGPTSWDLGEDRTLIPLRYNIKISFEAATGHTNGDTWYAAASPVNQDLGIVGNYNLPDAPYSHAGFFRDASDQKFKVFNKYDPEVSGNINTSHASFELGTMVASTFEGNLTGNVTGNVTGTVSDISNHTTTDLTEGDNLYYTTARHDSDTLAQVTSAYVQARQDYSWNSLTNIPDLFDSADATILVDSAYVQARQDFSYSLLTNVPDLFDSADATILVDSAYVQARQDYAYSSLTGLPDFVDSADVQLIVDSAYVAARSAPTLTVNQVDSADNVDVTISNVSTINFDNYTGFNVTDQGSGSVKVALGSGFKTIQVDGQDDIVAVGEDTLEVEAGNGIVLTTNATSNPKALSVSVDSSFVTDLVLANSTDSAAITGLVDSAYVQARQTTYTNFDTDFAAKSTSDLSEGTNLYYTTARSDSDTTALVNEAYIQARQIRYTSAQFVDSAFVTTQINNLIDGAPGTLDTLNEIAAALNDNDSAYNTLLGLINAKTDYDSADTIGIVDTAYVQARQDFAYSSLTGAPNVLDSADVNALITAGSADSATITFVVDSAYINARVDTRTDSATISNLVDSSYIYHRVDNELRVQAWSSSLGLSGSYDNFAAFGWSGFGGAKTGPLLERGLKYFEARVVNDPNRDVSFGLRSNSTDASPEAGINLNDGRFYPGNLATNFSGGGYFNTGDRLGVAYNTKTREVWFSKNDSGWSPGFPGIDSGYALSSGTDVYPAFAKLGSLETSVSLAIHTGGYNAQLQYGVPLNFNPYSGVGTIADLDSAWVAARQDSANITGIVTNAYVQARQDYAYSSLTGAPNILDSADVTKLVIAGSTDSATIIALVDSAYVQARQTPQDFSYTSLTDVPDLVDSVDVTLIVDASYVQARQDYAWSSLTGVPDFFDSNDATILIDSAYIQARQTTVAGGSGGTDSAAVINLIDSAYVQARQTPQDFAYSSLSGAPTNVSSFTNDARYLDSNSATNLFSSSITTENPTGVKWIDFVNSSSTISFTVTVGAKSSDHRYNGTGSSNGYILNGHHGPFIELVPGNTYRFDQGDTSNVGHPLRFYYEADKTTQYTTNVTTNGTPGFSGAYTEIEVTDTTPSILHYQCSSHAYMGNAVNVQTRNLTGFDTDDLTEGSTNQYFTADRVRAVIDSAYVIARQIVGLDSALADGFLMTQAEVISLVDSAYVQLRQSSVGGGGSGGGIDSAAVIDLIDSAYIIARQQQATPAEGLDSADVTSIINGIVPDLVAAQENVGLGAVNVDKFFFDATAAQTAFTGTDKFGNTMSVTPGNSNVYLNGVQLVPTTDYSLTATTLTMTEAVDSGQLVSIINTQGSGQSLNGRFYDYVATSGQTVFTGADRHGNSLRVLNSGHIVYLNGIALVDSADYTISNNTTVTFNSGVSTNDEVKIFTFVPADLDEINDLSITNFEFTADSGQTTFSGLDNFGASLNYDPDRISVYLNGLLLRDVDYTATNGSSIVLTAGADSADELTITKYQGGLNGDNWFEKVGSATLTLNSKNIIDCSAGAVTVTLPASPTFGDEVRVIDGTGNAQINNITIARNGNNILGDSDNLIIDINRAAVGLVYYNATQGWILTEN